LTQLKNSQRKFWQTENPHAKRASVQNHHDKTQGLSAAEARERLVQFGPNELTSVRRLTSLWQFLSFFANPLVIILLIASVISAFVGEPVNAAIIALVVLLSVALNFIQTARSQQAVKRLRAQVAPTASALRDGEWVEIPRREIVPGDVIRLSAGDLVPADALLIEARDLHVNQAALTGESLPVEKGAGSAAQADYPRDTVYLGSSIISGVATATVVATGADTAFGDIAARLAERPPETEFERGTRQFGMLITKTVFLLILFVLLVNIALRRDPLESVLFALALAVGLTPEFLPMITTVTLGQGAVRMARRKVIVKHLAAIQNFGSMDVLCSDKTGTLTSGETALEEHYDPLGNPAERVVRLAYLNSFHETGIKNPLDVAIMKHAAVSAEGSRKLDEIPFDFERRRLSIVVEDGDERLMITKGAPESVLSCCTQYETGGQRLPLDEAARASCDGAWRNLSQQGYRALAVAFKPAAPEQQVWRAGDEREMILAGFLTFSDPPLPDASAAIEALRRDGVKVKILTGDNELIARHVCSQVGLNAERIISGEEIDRLTPSALAAVAEKHTVFARVTPAQKHRIILALKGRGHVVGFLGDGINDAPSLHAADVGVSVQNAVDVAKDAAEIILLERDLGVLHEGIIEGRKAFGNVMKYLLMGTSSNFGNMFSMAGASAFLPFLPMLPTQILLNNFLYDLAQVTIPTDNVDRTYIHKPRRWNIKMIRDFMIYIGPISSIYDFLTFFVLLKFFQATEEFFHTGWFVESLATQTLVLFIIRTAGNPLRSRPSKPLTVTTLLVVGAGMLLPFTPLGRLLGFTPLPLSYFVFLVAATGTYLLLVELVKRRLMRKM
jgi:Mg2+-importing ATPase